MYQLSLSFALIVIPASYTVNVHHPEHKAIVFTIDSPLNKRIYTYAPRVRFTIKYLSGNEIITETVTVPLDRGYHYKLNFALPEAAITVTQWPMETWRYLASSQSK